MKQLICNNRLVDIQPKSSSQWLCPPQKIKRSIQIRIAGIPAVVAMEKTFISDTKFSTMGTSLGSISWTDSHSHMPTSDSLILNELPQLQPAPVAYFPIEFLASVPLSYSCQVLHNKEASGFNTPYNTFAYDVVHIPSKPLLSARQSFKVPLGRLSAFTLKPCFKASEPINMIFDIAEKLLVACNSNVVDTQVNTNHILDRAKVNIDLIGNTKMEEENAIPHKEFAFSNSPVSIFGEVGWYIDRDFDSAINCANTQDVVFEGEASWWVVSDTTIESWFTFSSFTAFISPFDSSCNKLGLELWELGSDGMVAGIVELEVRPVSFPAYTDSIIDCIRINREGIPDRSIVFELDFDYGSVFHIIHKDKVIYKPYGHLSIVQWKINKMEVSNLITQIHPTAKDCGLPLANPW